jgi:hypothetical protein
MASAFGLQWLANSWAFPLNVGGRPDLSWPNFVPITFVVSILCAGCSIFIGLLLILGLPEPYPPVFNSPAFNLDEERFYLFVAQADPGFDRAALTALFAAFPAARVEEVFP